MADRDDTLPGTDLNRLIPFELDSDEMLYVAAGRGEMENRISYNDNSDVRHAVGPVDELHERAGFEFGDDIDLDLGGLGIVGDTVSIPETGCDCRTAFCD